MYPAAATTLPWRVAGWLLHECIPRDPAANLANENCEAGVHAQVERSTWFSRHTGCLLGVHCPTCHSWSISWCARHRVEIRTRRSHFHIIVCSERVRVKLLKAQLLSLPESAKSSKRETLSAEATNQTATYCQHGRSSFIVRNKFFINSGRRATKLLFAKLLSLSTDTNTSDVRVSYRIELHKEKGEDNWHKGTTQRNWVVPPVSSHEVFKCLQCCLTRSLIAS